MQYKDKTKEQLINELAELHQGIENLEAEATKRKKAEEALKVSETRYRRLFETAQNGDIDSRERRRQLMAKTKDNTHLSGVTLIKSPTGIQGLDEVTGGGLP
ncbi:MAG TPA: hypothetical protein DEA95_05590, partial [Nitrospiraceae bacterium]|nr:hypothetical protein [Nitrospiraceae bacterium]